MYADVNRGHISQRQGQNYFYIFAVLGWNKRLWISIVISLSLAGLGNALHCLSCNDVIQPRHCHFVSHCAEDEYCFVEKFTNHFGEKAYNVGCRHQSICAKYVNETESNTKFVASSGSGGKMVSIDCEHCCDTDLCNFNGCGAPSLPSNHGPVCFSCGQSLHPSCSTIAVCEQNEVCYLERITEFDDVFYTSSCKMKHECEAKQLIAPVVGRKRDYDYLSTRKPFCCCSNNLCNGDCNDETTTPVSKMNSSNPIEENHKSTQFLFAFLEASKLITSYQSELHLSLLLAAENQVNVTIECPHIKMKQTYNLAPGFANITLDTKALPSGNLIENKGIYVESSKNISVYAFNQGRYETEGFSVLPTRKLSNKYIVISFIPDRGSVATIAALNDNTTVSVTLNTTGSMSINGSTFVNGDTFHFKLSKLYSLELSHIHDLTGTRIQSDKPISVVSGNICALSTDWSICQHLSEQLLPLEQWGKNFIVPYVPYSNDGFLLRLVPSVNNTGISMSWRSNYFKSFTTYSGHRIDLDLPADDAVRAFKANYPIHISMIAKFSGGNINVADPFMVNIPSIKDYGSWYEIVLPTSGEFVKHMVIVLIDSRESSGILINNVSFKNMTISNNNAALNSVEYSQVTIELTRKDRYIISHAKKGVRFGTIVLGYGYYTAYGYVAQSLDR